jgi:Fur family transcriptional regulator, zinc uptake regulator
MMTPSRKLLTNHEQVLHALRAAKGPMTAYEVLDAVRPNGISGPPTVYRALTRLIDEGAVHRLESINAYVVCMEPEHRHSQAAFTICRDCGRVEEMPGAKLTRLLHKIAAKQGFRVETATVELRGLCAACVAV